MGRTSIIEKMEKAIVPDVEQPYRIPKNWQWVYFGSVCRLENGYAFKSKYFSDDRGTPVVRISDINNNIVCLDNAAKTLEESIDKRLIVHYGDLLIAMSGATTGKNGVYLSHQLVYFNQRVGNVKTIREDVVLPHYRNYFILQKTDEILNNAYGGAQPNISSKIICNLPFPLIPLNEQQRIVDRIESLFAKLDEAKEKAQEVIDGFEDRRSAILSKAFSGELTNTWKESFIISSSKWTIKNFEDVAIIKSNLVDPADYQSYPHIAPDNIEKKTGRLLKYNTIAEDGVKSGKHRFYSGQTHYSKIRPNLSKVVVIDFDGLCSADMYPIEAKSDINTKFLWYYMLSDDFVLQASTAGSRSVLPKINQKELSSLKVQVTSLPEQERIVEILDSLFAKEQQAKETAEQIIEQIEVMKKAILARAFRGELGTNDPNDEPAIELLKRVLSEESTKVNEPKPAKKRITIPKELSNQLGTAMERKIIRLYFEMDTDVLSLDDIFSVSSKKFDVLDCIRTLEKKQIIIQEENGKYRLVR